MDTTLKWYFQHLAGYFLYQSENQFIYFLNLNSNFIIPSHTSHHLNF
jgi:hypothetical protein